MTGLALLNSATHYRFTGVNRFEGRIVKSVLLFDRRNPHLRIGADVPWRDSYCRLTAEDGGSCQIDNASADIRLTNHSAREIVQSYIGVLLRTPGGKPLGTLCHFDFVPRPMDAAALSCLRAVRGAGEAYIWAHRHVSIVPERSVTFDGVVPSPESR
jgi:hypothetical protein